MKKVFIAGLSVFFFSTVFSAASEEAAIKRPQIKYEAAGLRDPFQNPLAKRAVSQEADAQAGSAEVPLPKISVEGLIWGGAFPQAIINNKVVKEGDTIEDVQIISIEKQGVAVLFSGRRYNLPPPASNPVSEGEGQPNNSRRIR